MSQRRQQTSAVAVSFPTSLAMRDKVPPVGERFSNRGATAGRLVANVVLER